MPQEAATAERFVVAVCAQYSPPLLSSVTYVGDCKGALRLVNGETALRRAGGIRYELMLPLCRALLTMAAAAQATLPTRCERQARGDRGADARGALRGRHGGCSA
jgi:hypothetical protein